MKFRKQLPPSDSRPRTDDLFPSHPNEPFSFDNTRAQAFSEQAELDQEALAALNVNLLGLDCCDERLNGGFLADITTNCSILDIGSAVSARIEAHTSNAADRFAPSIIFYNAAGGYISHTDGPNRIAGTAYDDYKIENVTVPAGTESILVTGRVPVISRDTFREASYPVDLKNHIPGWIEGGVSDVYASPWAGWTRGPFGTDSDWRIIAGNAAELGATAPNHGFYYTTFGKIEWLNNINIFADITRASQDIGGDIAGFAFYVNPAGGGFGARDNRSGIEYRRLNSTQVEIHYVLKRTGFGTVDTLVATINLGLSSNVRLGCTIQYPTLTVWTQPAGGGAQTTLGTVTISVDQRDSSHLYFGLSGQRGTDAGSYAKIDTFSIAPLGFVEPVGPNVTMRKGMLVVGNTIGRFVPATYNANTLALPLDEAFGGTGFSTYAKGDMLMASAPNTLAKLPLAGTGGWVLTVNQATGLPEWRPAPVIPGPPGQDGLDGRDGEYGPPGPQGLTGPAGPIGSQGMPGPDGADGDPSFETGPPGQQGIQGIQGVAGSSGADGPQGRPGPDGADGEPSFEIGPPGQQGIAGPTGSVGPSGLSGSPGPDGADGDPSFETGPPGQQGIQGIQGIQGPLGPMGAPGPDGADGDPSFETGPPGQQGIQGATGAAGTNGNPGEDGRDGEPSFETGPPGQQGIQGPTGALGPSGTAGNPGEDGRDGEPSFEFGPPGLQGIVGPQGVIGPPGIDGAADEFADTWFPPPVPLSMVSAPFLVLGGNNLLRLGGITNAFPAIRNVGAALRSRLADDSADADFQAAAIEATGLLTADAHILVGSQANPTITLKTNSASGVPNISFQNSAGTEQANWQYRVATDLMVLNLNGVLDALTVDNAGKMTIPALIVSGTASILTLLQDLTAANDTDRDVLHLLAGADGTLGPLGLTINLRPSATAGSRYAWIGAGDNGDWRLIKMISPFSIEPAKKFYLDGGSDTYLIESSANFIDMYVGGVLGFRVAKSGGAGTLSLVSGADTGRLLDTLNALTDGAGAAAGTLTNAPSAGNPTKWLKINDGGVTRSVPAW